MGLIVLCLKSDHTDLDEVVVTGYWVKKQPVNGVGR